MPMQAESLEVLEKASLAPAQARAIVRAIEIEIAGAKDTLATKQDLLAMRQDLHGAMARHGAELRGEMKELGAALRTEMAERIGGVTRQMYVALLGQMTVMLGFFYFFLAQLR
jgi:hypothetical protein